MNPSSAALQALRLATGDAHDRLEHTLQVAQPDAGRAEYVAYVGALWGWMTSFEERLWAAPWPCELQAEARAGKCAWIEADLRDAGHDDDSLSAIAVCDFRPSLASEAERFGVAYVIEGAQLGSRALQKSGWRRSWRHGSRAGWPVTAMPRHATGAVLRNRPSIVCATMACGAKLHARPVPPSRRWPRGAACNR